MIIMIILLLISMVIIQLVYLILKQKITGQTNNDGEINGVEIMVPLKY